jgi:hypothetical protein
MFVWYISYYKWSKTRRRFAGAYHNASLGATTNFWSTGRAKQALASQHGPWQEQRSLGLSLLATADKNADHIALVSHPLVREGTPHGQDSNCQRETNIWSQHQDSIWSAHGSSDLPNSNAANWLWKQSPWPIGSPLSALAALWPASTYLAPKYGKTAIAHTSQPDAAGASLAFIRDLLGCLSKYWNRHSTALLPLLSTLL